MGRGTKTTEFLKLCLSEALVQLMEEKPFDSITIDEIAAEAGVGRATYFRNFKSKDELLSFQMDMLLKKWYAKHSKTISAVDGLKFLLEFYYSNKDFFLPIYKDEKGAEIMSKLDKQFFPQIYDEINNYQAIFYIGGIIGIFEKWFKCGFKESPEEMMKIMDTLQSDLQNIIASSFLSATINPENGKLSICLTESEK